MNQDSIVQYLKNLRETIIARFQDFETEARFQRKPWIYQKGDGGGEMAVLRGDVFEKAAVNFSSVRGSQFPGSQEAVPFYATGVSLITHMRNPKMPTVHFNIRYIEKGSDWWFGGGYDLTPMGFPFDEDTEHFMSVARKALDPIDAGLFPMFHQNAKEYFFIPHYGRERGVGGIFFDSFNSGDADRDLRVWHAVGDSFLNAILPIYVRRQKEPYSLEDRRVQLQRRAHYVEFNLLYDRGTKFGFQSGGNPEAILCSMPPLASW